LRRSEKTKQNSQDNGFFSFQQRHLETESDKSTDRAAEKVVSSVEKKREDETKQSGQRLLFL
jgi:hypothetical protein